jgi:hypothetical protein
MEDFIREQLNPGIPCKLSREFDEREEHAPVGFSSPTGLHTPEDATPKKKRC